MEFLHASRKHTAVANLSSGPHAGNAITTAVVPLSVRTKQLRCQTPHLAVRTELQPRVLESRGGISHPSPSNRSYDRSFGEPDISPPVASSFLEMRASEHWEQGPFDCSQLSETWLLDQGEPASPASCTLQQSHTQQHGETGCSELVNPGAQTALSTGERLSR